jgi:hypothetical protein
MVNFVVRQRGAIAVMTALFVVVLIGFAALALDLGRLYVLRTEMQNAVDAAAMAAAAELDYKEHAIYDARVAAKEAFTAHIGRFAEKQELLTTDTLPDSAFTFYEWIGSEYDGSPPNPCDKSEDPNKCRTTEDDKAGYVKVKLDPDLLDAANEGHYRISLFFLPVLSLITDDEVAMTASTKVFAVAGNGGPMLCNLPPLLICNPAEEVGGKPLKAGQMVKLKEQGAGAWQPGNFGFLQPFHEYTGSANKDLAIGMGSDEPGCTKPFVSTSTGNVSSYGRYGINTRFGIYDGSMKNAISDAASDAGIGLDEYKERFAPAPDVIDYPRDDNLTDEASASELKKCDFTKDSDRFGDNVDSYDGGTGQGLDHTEAFKCPATYGLSSASADLSDPPVQTDNDTDGWPDLFEPVGDIGNSTAPGDPAPYYNDAYHGGAAPTYTSRYEFYQWELGVDPDDVTPDPEIWQWAQEPLSITHEPWLKDKSISTTYLANNLIEDPCYNDDDCRIFRGDPEQSMNDLYVPDPGLPRRRIIYVAMLNCLELGITGNTDDIPVPGSGPFVKFFLTEHIGSPNLKTDIYAEYLGEVSNEERTQRIIKNQIQLYE